MGSLRCLLDLVDGGQSLCEGINLPDVLLFYGFPVTLRIHKKTTNDVISSALGRIPNTPQFNSVYRVIGTS